LGIKQFIQVVLSCVLQILLPVLRTSGQPDKYVMPKVIESDGRHALLVDGEPYFILGGQAHNSSGWPAMLPGVWSAIEDMHANTLEVPVYWEQIEPQPGEFNFSLIDTLLFQSRERHVHLVLLWFATWKNGSNHYIPGWMKQDASRYPNITGRNGKPVDAPSPNIIATLEADKKAFASVMRYLKKSDPQHTVIMVQVENESGSWGSVRDYSPASQKLIEGPVPPELLKPELLQALQVPNTGGGSWSKVFGDHADEYFHAWSVARFVGQVAAAGKSEYPLPMYVNAALRDPLTNPPPTNYESGGPTDNVIPIWKIAAPSLDFLAPDIYLPGSDKVMKVLELYDRKDNALFVPEISSAPEYAKYLYEVIARGGLGFSPFGIDDNGIAETGRETAERLEPFSREYATVMPMMRQLAKWGFEGKIKAAIEREDHSDQNIELNSWQATILYGSGRGNGFIPNPQPSGKAMIVQLDENNFIVTGTGCRITFHPLGKNLGRAWQYLKVEEGSFENGEFKTRRILNGDETDWGGPLFGSKPSVLRISLLMR
jgi:hypothetical protein